MAILIGLLIGLVLGLTGACGSVLAVPMLMAGLGLDLPQSAGLSLGAVSVAALVGVLMRLGRRQIVWAPALVIALSGALLTPVGRMLAQALPDQLTILLFAVLVATIALRMWRQASVQPEVTRILRAVPDLEGGGQGLACQFSPSGQFELKLPCLWRLLLVGALTGVLSGMFGVGGGFVVVPALVLLTGLPMLQAVATSLAVIAVVSGAGFVGFLASGQAEMRLLAPVAAGGLGGMLAGTVIGPRLAGPRLQQVFVVLMVLLAAYTVVRSLAGGGA